MRLREDQAGEAGVATVSSFSAHQENKITTKRLDQDHLHPKLEFPGEDSNPGLHGGRRAL
jgi:hypothetical protein